MNRSLSDLVAIMQITETQDGELLDALLSDLTNRELRSIVCIAAGMLFESLRTLSRAGGMHDDYMIQRLGLRAQVDGEPEVV